MFTITYDSWPRKLVRKTLPKSFRAKAWNLIHQYGRFRQSLRRDTTDGEFEMICAVLPQKRDGFIVDVGANDPYFGSVSRPFIRLGWKAILVEPHPVAFERLRAAYQSQPRVQMCQAACSNTKGRMPLHIGKDGDEACLSTLCNDDTLKHRLTGEVIEVDVLRLTEVLQQCKAPKEIDVLAIDAEGMDFEVLQGLDFSQFQPHVIVTEGYKLKEAAKRELLALAGYELFGHCQSNSLWRLRLERLRKVTPFASDPR
ncbi:MAG: FkbM family methyltransferase [Verrucomicrobiia bacterium]|jgi:FkbM family methyltransferase